MFISNDKFYLLTKQLNGFLVAKRTLCYDSITQIIPKD